MTIDDQIRDEKGNITIIEKLQKYLLDHQVKLIGMNILLAKKYYLLIKNK